MQLDERYLILRSLKDLHKSRRSYFQFVKHLFNNNFQSFETRCFLQIVGYCGNYLVSRFGLVCFVLFMFCFQTVTTIFVILCTWSLAFSSLISGQNQSNCLKKSQCYFRIDFSPLWHSSVDFCQLHHFLFRNGFLTRKFHCSEGKKMKIL